METPLLQSSGLAQENGVVEVADTEISRAEIEAKEHHNPQQQQQHQQQEHQQQHHHVPLPSSLVESPATGTTATTTPTTTSTTTTVTDTMSTTTATTTNNNSNIHDNSHRLSKVSLTPLVSTSPPQPQQPQQQQPRPLSSRPSMVVNRVNGKGMWKAWTRSFDTPMLALLDLFDNAVDASWTLLEKNNNNNNNDNAMSNSNYPFVSSISYTSPQSKRRRNIHHNIHNYNNTNNKPKIHVRLDDIGQHGIVMRNASANPIPPLDQVLEVYRSSKENADIGENGVGIKQACASLSTLSLVFTKTKKQQQIHSQSQRQYQYYEFGIGIIMEELQQEEGIVLPSCQIELDPKSDEQQQQQQQGDIDNNHDDDNDDDYISSHLEWKIRLLAANEPNTWGRAMNEYGDGSLEDGISMCVGQLEEMISTDYWKDCDNVFTLVLTKLRHAAAAPTPHTQHSTFLRPDSHDDNTAGAAMVDRSVTFLKEFSEKLPSFYLHLHAFEVSVQYNVIEPYYWEKRLVELTKFEVQIDQTKPWSETTADTAKYALPPFEDPTQTIRFFAGFDPYHCMEKKGGRADDDDDDILSPSQTTSSTVAATANNNSNNNASNNGALKICLYSRQTGRLIKVQNDPRNELGLGAGSTGFRQGMVLLVDDYNGTLPLNPTKQDTAFGHSEYGLIHSENIKEWTSAIAHFYWYYHFERLGNSKHALTKAVHSAKSALEKTFGGRHPIVPSPLSKGTCITFTNLRFSTLSKANIPFRIRATKKARSDTIPLLGMSSNGNATTATTTINPSNAIPPANNHDNDHRHHHRYSIVRLDEDAAAKALGLTTTNSSPKKRKLASKSKTKTAPAQQQQPPPISPLRKKGGRLRKIPRTDNRSNQVHDGDNDDDDDDDDDDNDDNGGVAFHTNDSDSAAEEDGIEIENENGSRRRRGSAAVVASTRKRTTRASTDTLSSSPSSRRTQNQAKKQQQAAIGQLLLKDDSSAQELQWKKILHERTKYRAQAKRMEENYSTLILEKAKVDKKYKTKMTENKRILAELERLRQDMEQRKEEVNQVKGEAESLRQEKEQLQSLLRRQQQQHSTSVASRFTPESSIKSMSNHNKGNHPSTTTTTTMNRFGINNHSSSTSNSSDSVSKLTREVQIFKSRAHFYREQIETLKKRIEDLSNEKIRYEERIQELEDTQLELID